MYKKTALLATALVGAATAQQVGTYTAESHPALTTYKCTKSGGCVSQTQSIVLDSNWRWVHQVGNYTNCYTGNAWNTTVCSDPVACAKTCALEGADYSGTYGISTSGNALTLKFITQGQSGANIGSRVYLMASESSYQMFQLKNQEFTFDVDVSNLPCGLNGALYLIEMDQDGGLSKYSTNKAGAKYGTGYCDTQCPHDIKFINGEVSILQCMSIGCMLKIPAGELPELDCFQQRQERRIRQVRHLLQRDGYLGGQLRLRCSHPTRLLRQRTDSLLWHRLR
jgi:cellulose 1,4-beta-cellobiosidase